MVWLEALSLGLVHVLMLDIRSDFKMDRVLTTIQKVPVVAVYGMNGASTLPTAAVQSQQKISNRPGASLASSGGGKWRQMVVNGEIHVSVRGNYTALCVSSFNV